VWGACPPGGGGEYQVLPCRLLSSQKTPNRPATVSQRWLSAKKVDVLLRGQASPPQCSHANLVSLSGQRHSRMLHLFPLANELRPQPGPIKSISGENQYHIFSGRFTAFEM